MTAVLEEWDRQTVETSLADVAGLDYFRRLPEVMAAHLSNRGLLELFTTISAEASSPAHPAHAFIQRRYIDNLATLATHLQQAVDTGDVASLTRAEIEIEVRLVTAVLDGIGLQWLLDPSTDVTASSKRNPISAAIARSAGTMSLRTGWTCTQTWSAPASRCARTATAREGASPWATTRSTRKSLPSPARSAVLKPPRRKVVV